MASSEKSSAQNDWPAGSNAFGLYLVLGVFFALIVIVVFGLWGRGRQDVVKEQGKPTITTTKHSTAAETGAGDRLPEKGTSPKRPADR